MKNILDLYKEGYTVAEIKAMKELSEKETENFVKNIKSEDLSIHKTAIRNRIIDMYNNGYSVNVINKKTSVSVSIIKKILA